jgi:hypothetical protein
VRRFLAFAASCAAVIAVALALLLPAMRGTGSRRALWIDAWVSLAVQVVAFTVVRRIARRNVIAGWGVGIIIRFATLIIFALAVVPRLGLPMLAALLGMAIFLFLTTLLEPLFLRS